MKSIAYLTVMLLLCLRVTTMKAQEPITVDKAYRTATIERLSELILAHYVYEDVAEKTADHLKAQLAAGAFDELKEVHAFAEALTKSVQSVNQDKHMRIRPGRAGQAPANTPERVVEDLLFRYEAQREQVAGFREARKIEGNIGYLDLRGFAPVSVGAEVADHYMYLLAGSDALIIDLRKNGGGDPAMVQYLCSFFFDGKVHLNSLYWREGDRTDEFWTLDEVGGTKMPDIPIFVLTSNYTFSGAEEFSYNMQTRERATLVGETTGGGANPGGGFPINEQLTVFIPTGAAINPVTKTNWEGVGVVPEVQVPAEEALDKAIELATEAAEAFRKENRELHTATLKGLETALKNFESGTSDREITQQLQAATEKGLLTENDINMLGYQYLHGMKNAETAEALFKANTVLFPQSANTFDSYAEALAANGKMEEAIKNYQKAVEVAEANRDENLKLFQDNLARAKAEGTKK